MRANQAEKRGGGAAKVELNDAICFVPERSSDYLALDAALGGLAELDPRKCKIIELLLFGGLEIEEIARGLDISTATVGRELRLARAWLYREVKRV